MRTSLKTPKDKLTRAYLTARHAKSFSIDPDTDLIPNRIKEADRPLNTLVIPPADALRFLP